MGKNKTPKKQGAQAPAAVQSQPAETIGEPFIAFVPPDNWSAAKIKLFTNMEDSIRQKPEFNRISVLPLDRMFVFQRIRHSVTPVAAAA